jgi:hypothetical protein
MLKPKRNKFEVHQRPRHRQLPQRQALRGRKAVQHRPVGLVHAAAEDELAATKN